MTVYVHGIYDEYNGLYSALIPLQFDEENVYIYNNEPIFINENGNKCIWKQVSGLLGWPRSDFLAPYRKQNNIE